MVVNNDYEIKNCPLCKSLAIRCVGDITPPDPTTYSSMIIELEQHSELYHCRNCKSYFTNKILSPTLSKELYTKGGASEKWFKTEFLNDKEDVVKKCLLDLINPTSRILDIGCNTGELLNELREFSSHTSGLDFSESSREIIKKNGHKAHGSLEEIQDESYDLITAFDLFEHLYDPQSFLSKVHDKLSPSGHLVIFTGDISTISFKLAKTNWWYSRYPEHVIFPSPDFFLMLSEYKLDKYVRTYASLGYKASFLKSLYVFFRKTFLSKYDGLHSFGPDHMIVVLSKRSNL